MTQFAGDGASSLSELERAMNINSNRGSHRLGQLANDFELDKLRMLREKCLLPLSML